MILALFFYAWSFMLIGAASCVVIAKNSIIAGFSLLIAFIATSGLWILLQMDFLALILIIVYVGAVMVLFLFMLMLLHTPSPAIVSPGKSRYLLSFKQLKSYGAVGLLCAFLLGAQGFLLLKKTLFWTSFYPLSSNPLPVHRLGFLGQQLFSLHLLPFECAGVLLLAAMVASMALIFRTPRARRTQRIDQQIAVKPGERLSLKEVPRA